MANAPAHPVLRSVRQLAAHLAATLPDVELLERFVTLRDEAAFAALVRRHGQLVLAACRRVLRDGHAAEDAFQATFVVLARKAASLRRPEALGPWLHGVATRTALKARAREARRRAVERRAATGAAVGPAEGADWRDLAPVLDEAISGLPDLYRVPFVRHHLEGATVAEVARGLGCPQGTVAARLARARERLRSGLTRRGLALSGAALGGVLTPGAAVPPSLVSGTVAAALLAAGQVIGAVAATAALVKGAFHVMVLNKLKVVAAVLLAAGALGVGSRVCHRGTPKREAETRGSAEDILVRVKEDNTGSLLFGVGVNSDSGLTGSIVLNERHFDILRPPTRCKDLEQGKAFRGAGQAMHVQTVPGTEVQGFKAGGAFAFLNSLEYQVPVRANDSLYLVPFVDSGTVEKAVEVKDYRVSAGFGVRFVVPMLGPVPISLDFGFPINKDREQVFSFWLGFFS
jgi:RNA polymerase sigma factor (sigma-70 family)